VYNIHCFNNSTSGLIITPTKSESNTDLLVLYRSREQTLASVPISPENFRFEVTSESVAAFVDSRGLAWDRFYKNTISAKTFRINFNLQIWDEFPPKTTYINFCLGIIFFISLILRYYKPIKGTNYKLQFHQARFYP
jgi:hypothetical protein